MNQKLRKTDFSKDSKNKEEQEKQIYSDPFVQYIVVTISFILSITAFIVNLCIFLLR